MAGSSISRVAIVGAGIGGLCAAALLRGKGIQVQVFEQASRFGEVGAGIQIGPNGVKVLQQLGLTKALEATGVRPQYLVLRGWKTGLAISRTGIAGDFDKAYGAPYFHIHRADLHRALLGLLPENAVRSGSRVLGLRQDATGVDLELESGTERFDVVVGADGIHSTVRTVLHGAEKPRFTGNVAFRAMVEADDELRRRVAMDSTIWVGPNGHVVHYYVRSGSLLNIVAVYEADQWTDESWTQEAKPSDLLAAFQGWNSGLLATLGRVRQCNRWALYDRDPMQSWGQGRVTLLGDAAHPMLPFLAQGGVMAIEDAYVLAQELTSGRDIDSALRLYEAARMKRTSRVQLAARAMGEKMHAAGRLESLRRNAKLFFNSRLRRDDQIERGQSLYGFDVTRKPGGESRGQRA